jgi:hypothetical protein
MRSIRGWPAVAASLFLACGAGPSFVEGEGGSVTQWEERAALGSRGPSVLVFVVDDEASLDAATLRATVETQLLSSVRYAIGPSDALAAADPAAWLPADVAAFVVHPTAPDAQSVVGPPDDSRLRWITDQVDASSEQAFAAAIRDAIEGAISTPGASDHALDRTQSLLSLLTHERAPASQREQAWLASLYPGPYGVRVVVAMTHDVAPAGAPPPVMSVLPELAIVMPAPSASCLTQSSLDPNATLVRWARSYDGVEMPLHCVAVAQSLFPLIYEDDDCSNLLPALQPLDSRGAGPTCRIEVTRYRSPTCGDSPALLDPMDPDGVRRRHMSDTKVVCEVRELAGGALRACVDDPACNGCEPGWCVTRATSFARRCGLAFRFVLGALPLDTFDVDAVCDVPGP